MGNRFRQSRSECFIAPPRLPSWGVSLDRLICGNHLEVDVRSGAVPREQPNDDTASSNFVKLGATTALAFWFLGYFESALWVGLIALIVPWVDAYSVWRGPTHHIVHHQQHLFTTLSFAFPVPGEHGSANLGVPDLLFFALFLAAAARWHLRVAWTWVALVASFGTTMALTVWIGLAGLPALPGLALGFLVPNADLLWAELERARARSRRKAGTDSRENPG